MTVRLPKDPKKEPYEDLVSAALTAHGYFVETRLVLKKEGSEILEFDAVATPSDATYWNPVLVEAKSGSFGISDLFKLYGQRMFTEVPRAWLIHREPLDAEKSAACNEVAKKSLVNAINLTIPALEASAPCLPAARALQKESFEAMVGGAWWGKLADRLAQSKFVHWCKSHGKAPPEAVVAARTYERAVAESFFAGNSLARARGLYAAYSAFPNVAGTVAEFTASASSTTAKSVTNAAWNNNEFPHLQYMMAVQLRARFRLVKNAFDRKFVPGAPTTMKLGGSVIDWDKVLESGMPGSFRAGMSELEAHPLSALVSYFYQVFTELLGGFYFPNDEDDVGLVSAVTSMPTELIRPTLNLMDVFFPLPNGSWIYDGSGGISFIKAVPAYMRGSGCFFRNKWFKLEKYTSKYPSVAEWHLVKWHNALYHLLEPAYGVEDSVESPPTS